MSDVDDEFEDTPDSDYEPVAAPDPKKLLDPAARAARSLAIRRAIETRVEQKRMEADLDYLEIDPEKD